ncbi:MAG: S8 family serine peptidase [Candidatus Sericytochromatia bacterium]
MLALTLLSACAAPAALKTPGFDGSRGERDFELIVQVRPEQETRFIGVSQRRLGARVMDRLTLAGKHYLLIGLDREAVRGQPYELPLDADDRALTRAAAEDLWHHHGQMLADLELNVIAEPPSAGSSPPAVAFNDLSFGIGSGLEGWWRTETQVEAAWRYAIGTGVTVAYLDQGFVRGHPELERRLVLTGQNNQTSEYLASQPGNIELPAGDHGTASLLVGFAERDNHLPSVGVAPNARFMPFVASTVWDAARALNTAAHEHPDVIGMNFAFPLYPKWQAYGEYRQYQLLKDVFAEIAATSKVPVVVPAHNYGEPVSGGPRDWVPVAWAKEYDNVIGVGGVQVLAGNKLKAWFSGDLLTGINARGSNYGDGLIWAPATLLDIANPSPSGLKPGSMNGTSAACPFVTAAVALLRSRVPELPAQRLREVLLQTARPVPADDLLQRPGASVPMIQVEAALIAALRSQDRDPTAYAAKELKGRIELRPDGSREFSSGSLRLKVLPTLVSLLPGIPSAADARPIRIEGWYGIHPLKADQLEILHIKEDSEP